MKKLYNLCVLLLLTLFFMGCEEVKDWSDPTDNVPPGPISNPVVENFSGGAMITYQLPTDNDLLGVKAMYKFSENDNERKAFSSAFRDTIILKGFPDTNERIVKLVCLDKSRNESKPVEVIIKPTKIPVQIIGETLSVNESFGGIFVSWENILKDDIGISLYTADSTGLMTHNYTYYSNSEKGGYSFRGFNNEPREFRIEIVDKWENYIVIVDTILTPLYEEKIEPYDKKTGQQRWRQFGALDGSHVWRGDANNKMGELAHETFKAAFDGNNTTMYNTGNKGNYLNFFTDDPDDEGKKMNPIYWILDLGRSCYLSRHVNWAWNHPSVTLASGTPRVFQLWGTNEEPKGGPNIFEDITESLAYWTAWPAVNGTDAWKKDWDLLADYTMIPPSGAKSAAEATADDKNYARANGFDVEVFPELTSKPYRYIRFVILETWGGSATLAQNGDWEFYGQEFNK